MRYFIYMALLFTISCNSNSNSPQFPDLRADSPENAARLYYQFLTSPDYGIYYDETAFYVNHEEEIMSTFEIADIDTVDNIVAVFTRYSVGSKIFRDVFWSRKVGDSWIRVIDTYDYRNDATRDWENGSAEMFADS